MTRPIELSIHLGAHKTATTHLQKSILAGREELLRVGVRSYGPEFLRSRGRTVPNLFSLIPWTTGKGPRRDPSAQLQFLAKGSKYVFLSDENFFGPLHRGDGTLWFPLYEDGVERVRALIEALPEARIRLNIAIRRADTFIESAYGQTVLSGNFLPPEEFVELHDIADVRWDVICRDLASLSGIRSVTVWRHEDYPAVFPYLTRKMLRWSAANVVKPLPTHVHQGLSVAAMREIERRKAADEPLAALDVRAAMPVTSENPRFELYDSDVRERAEELYAEQCREIEAHRKIEFVTLDALNPELSDDNT